MIDLVSKTILIHYSFRIKIPIYELPETLPFKNKPKNNWNSSKIFHTYLKNLTQKDVA